jgi:hypothetical protein
VSLSKNGEWSERSKAIALEAAELMKEVEKTAQTVASVCLSVFLMSAENRLAMWNASHSSRVKRDLVPLSHALFIWIS